MMNGPNKDIDSFFKDAASGYRVSPSPGLWQQIEKRFFGGSIALIRGTSIVIILLSLGITGYFVMNADSTPAEEMITNTGTHTEIREDVGEPVRNAGTLAEPGAAAHATETVTFSDDHPGALKEENGIPAETVARAATQSNDAAETVSRPAEITGQMITAEKNARLSLIYPIPPGNLEENPDLSPIDDDLRDPDLVNMFMDDYARKAELGMAVNLGPGVMFYDPNPNKSSFAADATLNYYAGRWTARAGAGVNHVRDAGRYDVHFKTYDSIGYYNEVTSFRFADDNPDSLIIEYKTTTVFDSIPKVSLKEVNNTYTYLYFPVSVSYRFWEKGRFSAAVSTGLAYSLLVMRNEPTVEWNTGDASLVRIDRIVPARVKSNWLWSVGLSLGYSINDKFRFTLEPNYSRYLNDIYFESPGWNGRRPYSVGVRVGLDFHF